MRLKSALRLLALAVFFVTVTVASASRRFPPLFGSTKSFNHALQTLSDDGKSLNVSLNFRLPNETYPEQYDIKLTTNVHKGENDFEGEVIIDIVVLIATGKIVLHAGQQEFSKVSIVNTYTGETEELSYEYEAEREFLTLSRKNTGKQFSADTKWRLTIIYKGKLRDDSRGFYITKYIDDNGNDRHLAATQFESTNARYAFPCYDEPDKRAKFTITIIHSPTYKAISNMPVNANLSSSGKTVFLITPSMSTYIVAFVVSDFKSTEGILNGLLQRIHSRASVKEDQEWALISSMLITQSLSKYYGIDFMLPKLDHVAMPNFQSFGMENWGLAIYSESQLLYNEHNSTVFDKVSISNTIAHEIAHQWFGNLVAIRWWTYLWLKEGFATLFSYKVLADIYPKWDLWQEFHVNSYQNALIIDSGNNPRPMTHYVETPHEISRLYDSVSYAKAACVLHMWSCALTDGVFQRGLQNYLTINQYNAAVEDQLFTAIQNAAKEENYRIPAKIKDMMGSWSRQGGYPLLTVTRNYEDGTFTVKQESFHSNETFKDEKSWYIPINYVVASQPDFRNTEATHYLLNVTEAKINTEIDKKDWLLLNKQSAYYYRIKYDETNYKLIAHHLNVQPFKFHARNRAQLMYDAFAFSVSNRLDHALLLQIMSYLKKEDQYAPWSTASEIFTTFNVYLMGNLNYNDFKFFVAEQVRAIFEKLGVNDAPGEHRYQKYNRPMIIDLACLADVEDCLQATKDKLKDFFQRNIPIERNVKDAIYYNGLKKCSDDEFEFFYKQLMDSTDPSLRRQLIRSLSGSENENHIKKFIYSSIDHNNNLHTSERYSLLHPVYSRSSMGLLTCIEFLNENWNEYGNLSDGALRPLDSDMRKLAKYVVYKNQEEKYLALLEKVKDSKHVAPGLQAYVTTIIHQNSEWLKANGQPLMNWFTQYHAQNSVGGSANLAASAVLIVFSFILIAIHLF